MMTQEGVYRILKALIRKERKVVIVAIVIRKVYY